jgi:hypothetical protein
MANRRGNRNRQGGGNRSGGGGSGGGGGGGGGNRGRGKGQRSGSNRAAQRDFWGYSLPRPEPVDRIRPAGDPTALIRSLGDPPLRGHGHMAPHYFKAVYERAGSVATALAAASDLLDFGTD